MNRSVLLSVFSLALFVAGCDKEPDGTTLQGSWQLTSWYGGNVPVNASRENPALTVIEFADSTYTQYHADTVVHTGTYKVIGKQTDINNDHLDRAIVFEHDFQAPFRVAGNKLVIHYGAVAADGVVNTYKRQSSAR